MLDRRFRIFWAGQTLATLGHGFMIVALPLLVLEATGSVAQMGLLTGTSGVVGIATGLVAGSLADRWDRRRLMIVCDLVRMVVFGSVPLVWLGGPQVWLLYVAVGIAAVFDMVFRVSYVAAVPGLVGRDGVLAANGRLETTNSLSLIVGPVLAGVVVAATGPTAAIAVNAAMFGASALALSLIRLGPAADAPTVRGSVVAEFAAGFRFLWATPVLRWLTILLTVVSLLAVGMADVLIFAVRVPLGGSESDVGLALGMAGVGTVISALLLPRLRRTLGFGPCWIGSFVLCAAAVAVLAFAGSVAVAAAVAPVFFFGLALAGISGMTLRQTITPDHLLGRVTAAFWTIHGSLGPIGAALLTAAVERFGVRGPLLVVCGLFALVSLVAVATPIRQRHPERAAALVSRARWPSAPA